MFTDVFSFVADTNSGYKCVKLHLDFKKEAITNNDIILKTHMRSPEVMERSYRVACDDNLCVQD